jgi:hypothetical protein
MTEMNPFGNVNFGHWNFFVIWPACAKPRLQKLCGGQALRRRQVLVIWCLSQDE